MVLLAAASTSFGSCIHFADSVNWRPAHPHRLRLKLYRLLQRYPVRDHWRRHSATAGSASRHSATDHRRPAKWPHHANIAQHFTGCPCLSASCSKLRSWHTTVSVADHQCISATSVHWSSPFLSFSASLCWQWWHDCTMYLDRALWSTQFPRCGTPDLKHVATSSQEQKKKVKLFPHWHETEALEILLDSDSWIGCPSIPKFAFYAVFVLTIIWGCWILFEKLAVSLGGKVALLWMYITVQSSVRSV